MRADQKIPISLMGICLLYRRDPPLTLVAENIPGNEMPMFRNLWENIRKDMPTKGRGKGEELDPLKLPTRFQTALQSLYGHYEKTFKLWEGKGIKVPPCFILVCQNTAISKLVYDFISGFHRRHACYWRLEEMLGKLRRPFYDVVRTGVPFKTSPTDSSS